MRSQPSPEIPGSGLLGGTVLAANAPASAKEVLVAAAELGLLCHGCGRPVENGFRFTRFLTQFSPELGGRVTIANQAVACVRDDCETAEELRATADVVQPTQFVWRNLPELEEEVAKIRAEIEAETPKTS